MSTTLRLSVDEYERMIARGAFDGLDRRIEVIHGQLREMNPAGPVHDDYIAYLLKWSAAAVAAGKAEARSQMGVRVGDGLPEPDFVLLRPLRYGRRRPAAADVLLLVEVSDMSLHYDLGEKAAMYAAGGIDEYWVIDVVNSRLLRHLEPADGSYARVDRLASPEKVSLTFDCDLALDLQDFFLPAQEDRKVPRI